MKTKQSYVDLILVFIKVTHSLFLHFQTTIQFHFYVTTEKVSHFVFAFSHFFLCFLTFCCHCLSKSEDFQIASLLKTRKGGDFICEIMKWKCSVSALQIFVIGKKCLGKSLGNALAIAHGSQTLGPSSPFIVWGQITLLLPRQSSKMVNFISYRYGPGVGPEIT